jgi:tetratricopeptide (TPR) repeat protein
MKIIINIFLFYFLVGNLRLNKGVIEFSTGDSVWAQGLSGQEKSLSKSVFEVNLDKLAKNLKVLDVSRATEKEIQARGPAARMRLAIAKRDWKACADLRNGALKDHPLLGGWIWSQSLKCELNFFEQSKSNGTPLASRARLFKLARQFDTEISWLDRGPWKKELQSLWIQMLQTLKTDLREPSERAEVAHLFFRRPEFLSPEQERELLNLLQAPFEATQSLAPLPALKTTPQMTEPWSEAARKMDFEQVVVRLQEYFSENKSPSNFLAAKLLQGKAFLWTGRYEEAKKAFETIIESASVSEEGLEAQFRLGLLQLRLGNAPLALKAFDQLLATNREKNTLATRYWRLRALQMTGVTGPDSPFEKERSDLIAQFPFTYFGLKLRAEGLGRQLQFPEDPLPTRRSVWTFPLSSEPSWKRFKELLKLGYHWEAAQEIQDILTVGEAEAYHLWADFFADVGLENLALRFGQSAQNLDERLAVWSFQKKFLPRAFDKIVQEQAQTHRIEPWIIWGVMRQESAFNMRATSASNAYGLMQLIGPTAQEVATDLKTSVEVPEDLFRPEKNIPLGARYLAKMKNEFGGHWPLAVASYNAGPTRLKAWLKLRKDTESLSQSRSTEWRDEIWIDELPWSETQNYVKAVMRNYLLYRLGSESNWTLPPVFWSESEPSQGVSSRRLIEKKSIKR